MIRRMTTEDAGADTRSAGVFFLCSALSTLFNEPFTQVKISRGEII